MPELVAASSVLDAAEVSPQTTVGVLLRQAERSPARPLLHFLSGDDWKSLSWRDVRQSILRIAGALVARGVEPGDRVVIMSENRPEWILADFAIQLIGGTTVPIYPTLTPAGACEIAIDSGAKLAIVASALRGALKDASLDLITIDEVVSGWMASEPPRGTATIVSTRARALRAGDVATVIYTSGTTGSPKGVVLTHQGIVAMAAIGAETFGLGPDDVLLSFLPYSHVFERVEGIMVPITVGATLWISRGAQFLSADLQAARPTLMLLVPRVLEKMLTAIQDGVRKRGPIARAMFWAALAAGRRASARQPGALWRLASSLADRVLLNHLRERLTGGRLRFVVSGGAPLSPEVESFFWSIGLPIYQGWGLTETSAAATANRPGASRHGSVGQALPGVQVRVERDGELLVRSPGVMREYFGKPEETAEVLNDGWFRTGDVGAIDAEGYVTITDRKKDLIKTSTGKYVAPQPVEARLQGFRYIAAAVLIGDQRPYIVALIQPAWDELRRQLQLDGPLDALAADRRVHELIKNAVDSINRGLANFEAIRRFRILATEFTEAGGELTPSLKVRRRLVQQRYQRLIDEMYGAST